MPYNVSSSLQFAVMGCCTMNEVIYTVNYFPHAQHAHICFHVQVKQQFQKNQIFLCIHKAKGLNRCLKIKDQWNVYGWHQYGQVIPSLCISKHKGASLIVFAKLSEENQKASWFQSYPWRQCRKKELYIVKINFPGVVFIMDTLYISQNNNKKLH